MHAQSRTPTKAKKKADYRGGIDGYDLAQRLESERQRRRLSVNGFAELLDISPSLYSAYRKGSRAPTVEVFRRIARALQVSTDWLLFGDAHPRALQERTETGEAARLVEAHVFGMLAGPPAGAPRIPLDIARQLFPTPLDTLRAIQTIVYEHARTLLRARTALAWHVVADGINALPPNADEDEQELLRRVAQSARGRAVLALQHDLTHGGWSRTGIVDRRIDGGRWVAVPALLGAGEWVDGLGLIIATDTPEFFEERVLLSREGIAAILLPKNSLKTYRERGRAIAAASSPSKKELAMRLAELASQR